MLLSSGPGPGSLLAAADAWNALSAEYALAADELTAALTSVQAGVWEGPSAESYAAAHVPYLAWLMQASVDSTAVAARHETAAAAYTAALVAMPTMAELAANHAVHGVLLATNFFGVNMIPIALNEADYVRMWVQAASTMTSYQAVSAAALASSPQTQPAPTVVNPAASGPDTVSNAIQAIEQLLHDASTLNLSDLQSSLLNVVQNFNVTAFLQNPVGYSQQIVESLVNNFPILSDLYYGFGGDHIFELLTDPVGFVQHIISNFLANPLGVIANPFTLLLSADDYPVIFYPLISPAIVPAFAIASVGSAGGLAGLAAIPPTTMPVITPVLAPAPLSLPAGTTPTVVVSAVAPAAAPASAPAPASPPAPAATATGASPAPPLPPAGAPFVPPYAVGPPGIGFDSGMSAGAASRAKRKAPESDSAIAEAAAAVRGQRRARRRRQAISRDHADEFADMNVEVNPDWDAPRGDEPMVSDNGAGQLGFAGTVRDDAVERAAGLATLAGDGFTGGPRVPMVPRSWEPDVRQQ